MSGPRYAIRLFAVNGFERLESRQKLAILGHNDLILKFSLSSHITYFQINTSQFLSRIYGILRDDSSVDEAGGSFGLVSLQLVTSLLPEQLIASDFNLISILNECDISSLSILSSEAALKNKYIQMATEININKIRKLILLTFLPK